MKNPPQRSPELTVVTDTGTPQTPPPPSAQDTSAADTGLTGLTMLARFHGVAVDPAQLAHEYQEDGQPLGIPQILLAAKRLGLKATLVRSEAARLDRTPLPALAVDMDGRFFLLARYDATPGAEKALIQELGAGGTANPSPVADAAANSANRPRILTLSELTAESSIR